MATIVLPAWHFASKHRGAGSERSYGNPGDLERIQIDSCVFFHQELCLVNWESIENEVQISLANCWY